MDAHQFNACADLVAKGDPDRFLAAMAAPLAARGPLFVLYALNLELARAPWVTKEPLIAQMRLQFWRDVVALEEFKAHDVAAPLQAMIRAGLPVAPLSAMINAREAEIGTSAPFGDEAALWAYLEGTGGALMQASVAALGSLPEEAAEEAPGEAARQIGTAQALANYLQAIPALEAAGRLPLPDGRPEAVAALARQGLAHLTEGERAARSLPAAVRPALRAAWLTRGILSRAARDPSRVAAGALAGSEFMRRGGILFRVLSGN